MDLFWIVAGCVMFFAVQGAFLSGWVEAFREEHELEEARRRWPDVDTAFREGIQYERVRIVRIICPKPGKKRAIFEYTIRDPDDKALNP